MIICEINDSSAKKFRSYFHGKYGAIEVFFEGLYLNLESSLRLPSEKSNKVINRK